MSGGGEGEDQEKKVYCFDAKDLAYASIELSIHGGGGGGVMDD